VGRAIAASISDRWAFEAVARSLALGEGHGSSATQRVADVHGMALSGPIGPHAVVMVALAVVFVLAARFVLERRTR
jgi:hypothetical protein